MKNTKRCVVSILLSYSEQMTAASRCRSTRTSHELTLFRRERLQETDSLTATAITASSWRLSLAVTAQPASP